MAEENENNNIELFDCYTSKILAHLYSTFPVKQHLKKEFFIEECDNSMREDEKIRFVCDTMIWLKENNFIHYTQHSKFKNCNFTHVSLTMQGLVILKSEPKTVTTKETIGDKLVEMVRLGANTTAAELTKQAIMKMIG